MPLFQIQDSDRPAFVLAQNYNQAVGRWQHAVAIENDGEMGEPPQGVALVADDEDLVLDDDGFLPSPDSLQQTKQLLKELGAATSPGEVAYQAYCQASGGVSLISGAKLPQWGEQNEQIQAAWEAAARVVLRAYTAKHAQPA